jgi:hypothetical protein
LAAEVPAPGSDYRTAQGFRLRAGCGGNKAGASRTFFTKVKEELDIVPAKGNRSFTF